MLAGSSPISIHKFAPAVFAPTTQLDNRHKHIIRNQEYKSTSTYLTESSHACSHLRAVVTSLVGRPRPAGVAELIAAMVAEE